MARYSFILDEEIRAKLLAEGLNIEPRLLNVKCFFEDISTFYNSSTNSATMYPIGAFSFSRSGANLLRVGNYSSIDNATRIMGENHPYERFTTSTICYQKNGGILAPIFTSTGLDKLNKLVPVALPPNHSNGARMKKFRIGSDVWLRHDVILAPDITLATGCCVEQGSVVNEDVPPYAIVSGNPAKIVGYRFPEKIIEKLLETRWTEYDITPMDIKADIDIEKFIDSFYDYKDKGKIKPIILKNLKEVFDRLNLSYETI